MYRLDDLQWEMLEAIVEHVFCAPFDVRAGEPASPEQLAEVVIEGLADERFLILPHPEVVEYMRRKTQDYDRWIGGMNRLQQRLKGAS